MEKREEYYELYKGGQLYMEGNFEECYAEALSSLDDDCVQVYKVTVMEEKVEV